jgi:hypothetical protein
MHSFFSDPAFIVIVGIIVVVAGIIWLRLQASVALIRASS